MNGNESAFGFMTHDREFWGLILFQPFNPGFGNVGAPLRIMTSNAPVALDLLLAGSIHHA